MVLSEFPSKEDLAVKARKNDKPLRVEITLVPLSEEEWQDRLNVIAEVLFDSVLRELGVKQDDTKSKETLTNNDNKLQLG